MFAVEKYHNVFAMGLVEHGCEMLVGCRARKYSLWFLVVWSSRAIDETRRVTSHQSTTENVDAYRACFVVKPVAKFFAIVTTLPKLGLKCFGGASP